MISLPWCVQRSSCGPQVNLFIYCIRITFWNLSMGTPESLLEEVERLRNENDTLRKQIRELEIEVTRLQDAAIRTWGSTC